MIVYGSRTFWRSHIFQKWIQKGITEVDIEISMIKLIWKLLIRKDRNTFYRQPRPKVPAQFTFSPFFICAIMRENEAFLIETFYSSSLEKKSEIKVKGYMKEYHVKFFFTVWYCQCCCACRYSDRFGPKLQHCVRKFGG